MYKKPIVSGLMFALLLAPTANAAVGKNGRESVPAKVTIMRCGTGITMRVKNYAVKCAKKERYRVRRLGRVRSNILSSQRPRYRGSNESRTVSEFRLKVKGMVKSGILRLREKARLKRLNENS